MRIILAAATALSLLATAGCGLSGGGTPPKASVKTKACAGGSCARAMVMSADGRWVAVAGHDIIEVFDVNDPGGSVSEITIGAEALATSPDGAYLLIQHGADSAQGVGLRILGFDSGVAVWRTTRAVVGVLTNPRHSPFRQDGNAVEVSPYNDYREVGLLNWRSRTETTFSGPIGTPAGVRITPLAVAQAVHPVAGWLEGDGKPRLVFGYGENSTLVQAEPAWPERPSWRAFSLDGTLFGAEHKGEVGFWEPRTGRLLDRIDDKGPCVLAGAAPRINQMMAVCADRAGEAGRLAAWLFPGRRKVAEAAPTDGWTIRDWRVSDNGSRLVVLETQAAGSGGAPARLRILPIDATGATKTIELGEVSRPGDILISMSGSGRKLAVRMPDGVLRLYEPESIGV